MDKKMFTALRGQIKAIVARAPDAGITELECIRIFIMKFYAAALSRQVVPHVMTYVIKIIDLDYPHLKSDVEKLLLLI